MDFAAGFADTGRMTTATSPLFRIYVVEDSPMIRDRLIERLAMLPAIRVSGFSATVRQAIAELDSAAPDAVILDLTLADGTGLMVLEYLRRHLPSVVVIVMTNHAQQHIQDICLRAGAAYFIDKTAGLATLLDIVGVLSSRIAQ